MGEAFMGKDAMCKKNSEIILEQENDLLKNVNHNDLEFDIILSQYEFSLNEEERKRTGSFYTDREIIKFMLGNTLFDFDIVSNPFIKILDPSCGCGYFLLEAYDLLKQEYMDHMETINKEYPNIKLTLENLHEHILNYNIFGADCDLKAAKLASTALMMKKPGSQVKPNIICCDSVMDWENTLFEYRSFWSQKFDIIIGNPPYIGHKNLTGEYKKSLKRIYRDIFKDKADLSFCFIKSSIDRLCEDGVLCFITSRYFLESPSGQGLREYIVKHCSINRIIDFYGIRIMKGISVDPVIIFLRKTCNNNDNIISVDKALPSSKSMDKKDLFLELKTNEGRHFQHFSVKQKGLNNSGWVLRSDEEMSIIQKIEKRMDATLSSVCSSFQGIITGCDKAFIVDESKVAAMNIERDILRRWIKNSNINKYKVKESSQYIIYSDLINDTASYRGAMSYIEKYKNRLVNRRECKRGVRQWYQLQWGRDSSLFERKKIVFPYKSSCNRFAMDTGSYSSADVYGMYIKDQYISKISYEFLLGILNSKLYEFYFKCFGKKLGEDLYDYYPNTVMRLKVPLSDDTYIKGRVLEILDTTSDEMVNFHAKSIDNYLYKFFNLTEKEIQIVEGML